MVVLVEKIELANLRRRSPRRSSLEDEAPVLPGIAVPGGRNERTAPDVHTALKFGLEENAHPRSRVDDLAAIDHADCGTQHVLGEIQRQRDTVDDKLGSFRDEQILHRAVHSREAQHAFLHAHMGQIGRSDDRLVAPRLLQRHVVPRPCRQGAR